MDYLQYDNVCPVSDLVVLDYNVTLKLLEKVTRSTVADSVTYCIPCGAESFQPTKLAFKIHEHVGLNGP
jgi:hypothetical protein